MKDHTIKGYFRWLTKILVLAVLLVAVCKSQIHAQQQSGSAGIRELKVGDSFPDHRFSNLVNFPKGSLSLNSLRGKLVLLDLWSTSCTGCILSWPKLLSLQEKFSGRIQIVLVNPWQTKQQITDIIARRKRTAGVDMTLPIVYGDTTILKFFPTQTVPHVVWVDSKGTIRSITHGTELSERKISAALDNNNFKHPQKLNGTGRKYDPQMPLYINGNGGEAPKTLWQSILTKGDPNLWRGLGVTVNDSVAYCIGTNASVSELYGLAYGKDRSPRGEIGYLPRNRIVFEVRDSSKYLYWVGDEVNYDHFVTYSLSGPPMSAERIQKHMQEDLRRYFPLEARWEERKSLCYVWKCSDTTAIAYKTGERTDFIYTANFHANKITMATAFWSLNYATNWGRYPYPLVDETGMKGLIGGIKEEGDVLSPEALSQMLAKYKITITLEERTIPFLVIRQRKDD